MPAAISMDPTSFSGNSLPAVRFVTRQAEESLAECSLDLPDCIADALDRYAAALRQIDLPRELRTLPNVVATAASRVRRARTPQEASRAVRTAIAEVHKAIELVRADDPFTQRVETRAGALVAQTLEVADAKLERAVGL